MHTECDDGVEGAPGHAYICAKVCHVLGYIYSCILIDCMHKYCTRVHIILSLLAAICSHYNSICFRIQLQYITHNNVYI